MKATSRWFGVSLLACCAVIAVWGWGVAGAADPASAPKAEAGSETSIVRSLRKQRLAELESIRELVMRLHQQGTTTGAELQKIEEEILQARLELSESAPERIEICTKSVKLAETRVELTQRLVESGIGPQADVIRARIGVIDAKIQLEKEKEKGTSQSKR